jgi:phosphocarrier protein
MPIQTIVVSNRLGLHARASAKLTQLAGRFPCNVSIQKDSRKVNAKSIMGVMMLAAGKGSQVIVEAEGDQSEECLAAIVTLFNDKFGEGE